MKLSVEVWRYVKSQEHQEKAYDGHTPKCADWITALSHKDHRVALLGIVQLSEVLDDKLSERNLVKQQDAQLYCLLWSPSVQIFHGLASINEGAFSTDTRCQTECSQLNIAKHNVMFGNLWRMIAISVKCRAVCLYATKVLYHSYKMVRFAPSGRPLSGRPVDVGRNPLGQLVANPGWQPGFPTSSPSGLRPYSNNSQLKHSLTSWARYTIVF